MTTKKVCDHRYRLKEQLVHRRIIWWRHGRVAELMVTVTVLPAIEEADVMRWRVLLLVRLLRVTSTLAPDGMNESGQNHRMAVRNEFEASWWRACAREEQGDAE